MLKKLWSLKLLAIILIISGLSNIIANDKPLLVVFKNSIYFPIIEDIEESTFIDAEFSLSSATDFKDPVIIEAINKDGWILLPLIKFNYDTISFAISGSTPTPPNSINLLGTDDQGRDVLARVIYSVRNSLFFGIALSAIILLIGIFLGAIQGYFGGKIDLILQRFTEIWSGLPVMFLLLIISAIIEPSFIYLLLILSIFGWMHIASFVRAEFLRLRNFDFIRSANALGASHLRIIFRHLLPNALPIIIANLPFLVAGSITTLTALDFLGFGLPIGSASLGELLNQGKNNLNAYWLGITSFVTIATILTLLIFIGEDLRKINDKH